MSKAAQTPLVDVDSPVAVRQLLSASRAHVSRVVSTATIALMNDRFALASVLFRMAAVMSEELPLLAQLADVEAAEARERKLAPLRERMAKARAEAE